ncbi:BrnA antitoxin family protein [Pinisolibacter sp.]|uniref:BrnA antitoxin family protein n=1 Tax=Pinisolibacter sp. TaxID=2172024 RepID=UPI002FDC8BF3
MPEPVNSTPRKGRTDWVRLRAMSDEAIEAAATADAENPPADDDHWAHATVGLPPAKVPVNAKFDADVVAWFKAQGRGYQTRMNAVLRRYMEAQQGRR